MEPEYRWPHNYDARLLDLAHYYMGYQNFSSGMFKGQFETFRFPTYTCEDIKRQFREAIATPKEYDFCIFARHDPNFRSAIAEKIRDQNSYLAGPLFGREVTEKFALQKRCKFEFITENDLNEYYVSEKLGQALVAGCVPIYLGGESVKKTYPADLFIDMRDFLDDNGKPLLDDLLADCSDEGVYRKIQASIAQSAEQVLVEYFSI